MCKAFQHCWINCRWSIVTSGYNEKAKPCRGARRRGKHRCPSAQWEQKYERARCTAIQQTKSRKEQSDQKLVIYPPAPLISRESRFLRSQAWLWVGCSLFFWSDHAPAHGHSTMICTRWLAAHTEQTCIQTKIKSANSLNLSVPLLSLSSTEKIPRIVFCRFPIDAGTLGSVNMLQFEVWSPCVTQTI